MLTGVFHDIFRVQIQIFSFYCAIPYRWESKSGRLTVASVTRTWIWKCLALVHIRYALFLLVRLVQSLVDKNYTSAEKLAVFGWVALHNCSTTWYLPLLFKRVALMEVINFMIDFEVKYVGIFHHQRSDKFKRILKVMLVGSSLGVICLPYVIPLIFWLSPCEPQFLSSMFLSCTSDGSWTWSFMALKVVFLVIEIIASQQMVFHTIFMIFTCYYLMIKSLQGYLTFIQTIRVLHFHFRPVFIRRLKLYRRLQLLISVLNEVFNMTLLIFKIIMSSIIMTLIYFFVKMYKPNSGFPVIGQVCIHLSLAAAVIILRGVYGTSGEIYKTSEQVVKRWQRLGPINRLRWVKTNFQAIRPIHIRIGFGYFSFITPCTWLNVLYFCAKHAVLFSIIAGERSHILKERHR